MSIHWIDHIWDHSQQSGTALLMLLAIADHANDDGICWPSIARLAAKARVTERQAKRLIATLEESGELEVLRGDGRGHTSLYRIKGDIQGAKGDINVSLCDPKRVTSRVKKGDIQGERVTSRVKKGDIAMSPEPSKNHHIEPSRESSSPPMAGDDDGSAAKALIAELRNRRFMYVDSDSRRIADNLLSEYGMSACYMALEKTAAKHLQQINSGGRGIMAPLAYMQSILANGNNSNGYHPPPSKVEQSLKAVDEAFDLLEARGYQIP